MRTEIELYENQCAVCGVPFFQKKRGRLRRTCGAACRQALYRMRQGEKTVEKEKRVEDDLHEAGCLMCGEPLEQPKTGRRRKTCSDRCRKRLWRRNNPRCVMCGRHFTMAKYQKEQKYCSEQCRWRANKAAQRYRERQEALARMPRPEWLPRPGGGYRVEVWDEGELEEVVEQRKPEPVHEREIETVEERREQEHKELEELNRELEEQRAARRLAWELLEAEW